MLTEFRCPLEFHLSQTLPDTNASSLPFSFRREIFPLAQSSKHFTITTIETLSHNEIGEIMLALPPEPETHAQRLDQILLTYLHHAWPWAGGDGLTVQDALSCYPGVPATGKVPDWAHLPAPLPRPHLRTANNVEGPRLARTRPLPCPPLNPPLSKLPACSPAKARSGTRQSSDAAK